RNPERGENNSDDKDVVYTKGEFDQITGDVFECGVGCPEAVGVGDQAVAVQPIYNAREGKRKGNPKRGPFAGFFAADDMRVFIEYAQIQGKKNENRGNK